MDDLIIREARLRLAMAYIRRKAITMDWFELCALVLWSEPAGGAL